METAVLAFNAKLKINYKKTYNIREIANYLFITSE